MRFPRQLNRKKLLLISLVFVLIIGAAGFFGHKILTENKISRFGIEAQNLNCTNTDEIKGFLQSLNLNYFYFKKDATEEKLKQKFFCIGSITSDVSYPDKLNLKIDGRVGKFVVNSINATLDTNPAVVLSLDQMNATQSTTEAFPPKVLNQILKTYKQASESAMFLVDEEGMVFQEISTDSSFPRISIFSGDLKIGNKLANDLIKKVTLVSTKLQELDISSDNLLVVGDKLIVDSKPRVTFSLNWPIDRQAASLQLILAQAKMNLDPRSGDTRSVESIDLRFERPVVVYGKK